eukprot:TRINITY_DN49967_c0_g1_i1.p1 TRINITY_DN49967_c0_g1~~TRINITY_DN49967_c0_g1_i1.p1  ORF type:complete len:223 (+),score=56.47 TRINITY_DN49967_c0_g1_i1:75-743(+)
MAAASLSPEQLVLAKWRLEHGETSRGRPFYDDPKFAKFCELANLAEQQSKAGASGALLGKPLSPEVVEEMHFCFVNAQDGAIAELESWKRFCDMLAETEKLRGCIDAPLRDTGERATHRACEVGSLQNLKWLVEHGADINATTAPALQLSAAGDMSLGLSPAHVAAQFGQTKVLEFLKSVGADLNIKRTDGATALDFAVDQEHAETADWLRSNGGVSGLPES